MKTAIINLADTGACESTAYMLEAVGYQCVRPTPLLIATLRKAGLDNVLDSDEMQQRWGYDTPRVPMGAMCTTMADCDLFVDTKAHVNYPKIIAQWPNLTGKVLWCCLNGGDPLRRTDGQPWANPPCPVLTNNQWYGLVGRPKHIHDEYGHLTINWPQPWRGRAYVCYPPYVRLRERLASADQANIDGTGRGPPVCLVHNVARWGYGDFLPEARAAGVKLYGGGDGNDELLQHADAMHALERALAYAHLKIGDTVGYSVVEAMASGTPVVCTQFYIDECRLGGLLEPDRTCLTFDPKKSGNLARVLDRLRDSDYRDRFPSAAAVRLMDLMWDGRKERNDIVTFSEFMNRNFS